jgi:alanyl-tRNA synthetase
MMLTRRCTKIRQDWRLEFVCGGRAEKVARGDFQLLRQVAEKLSCAPEDVVSSASRALAERDANFKKIRMLLERLAGAEAALALQAAAASADGLRIISRVFEDVASEYLGFFGTAITKTEKAVALIGLADGGDLLFAQNPSLGKDMNVLLKQVFEKLGGKGGGTRDFVRGKLGNATQVESALALARQKLSGE